MTSKTKDKALLSAREESQRKVRAHRERLRAQGPRPVQIWAADTRAPGFAAKAQRQARRVAVSRHSAEDQAFVDAISSEFAD